MIFPGQSGVVPGQDGRRGPRSSCFPHPALAKDEGRQRFVAYSDMQLDDANPLKHQEMVEQGIVPWSMNHAQSELDERAGLHLDPG